MIRGASAIPTCDDAGWRRRHRDAGVVSYRGGANLRHSGAPPGEDQARPSGVSPKFGRSRVAEQRSFTAMLEDAIFWIAIAVTVAGLVAVAVIIARG
jgi:hypothetical protein